MFTKVHLDIVRDFRILKKNLCTSSLDRISVDGVQDFCRVFLVAPLPSLILGWVASILSVTCFFSWSRVTFLLYLRHLFLSADFDFLMKTSLSGDGSTDSSSSLYSFRYSWSVSTSISDPDSGTSSSSSDSFLVTFISILSSEPASAKASTETYLLELTPYKGLCIGVCLLNGQ